MINEGKGITNNIKDDVDKIWDLFLQHSYSTHIYNFGNERIKYRDITIKFNYLNNYYSNITIDRYNILTVNIGIPINGKEKRVKENISHELTHVVEILGLNNKPYPKYNKIKVSLIKFNEYPMSKAMSYITNIFYKTLDNEINANIAQTYIYIKSDGRCTKDESLKKLKEWETYQLYDNVKKIKLDILLSELDTKEVSIFNDILRENKVETTKSNDIKIWLNFWFKIFKRKSNIFLENSERILDEIDKDWDIFVEYVTSKPNDNSSNNIEYSKYISNFEDFKNSKDTK